MPRDRSTHVAAATAISPTTRSNHTIGGRKTPSRATPARGASATTRGTTTRGATTRAAPTKAKKTPDTSTSVEAAAATPTPRKRGAAPRATIMASATRQSKRSKIQDQEAAAPATTRASSSHLVDFYVIPNPKKGVRRTPLARVSVEHPVAQKYVGKTISELQDYFRENNQYTRGRREQLIRRCIDGEISGALLPCSRCKRGQLHFDEEKLVFVCTGFFDNRSQEYFHCGTMFDNPPRVPWKDVMKQEATSAASASSSSAAVAEPANKNYRVHRAAVEDNEPLVDLIEEIILQYTLLKSEDKDWSKHAHSFVHDVIAIENIDERITPGNVKKYAERKPLSKHIHDQTVSIIKSYLESGNDAASRHSQFLNDLKNRIRDSDHIKEHDNPEDLQNLKNSEEKFEESEGDGEGKTEGVIEGEIEGEVEGEVEGEGEVKGEVEGGVKGEIEGEVEVEGKVKNEQAQMGENKQEKSKIESAPVSATEKAIGDVANKGAAPVNQGAAAAAVTTGRESTEKDKTVSA